MVHIMSKFVEVFLVILRYVSKPETGRVGVNIQKPILGMITSVQSYPY